MLMKDLVIFGAGGCGREVADTVARINKISNTYNLIGFADERCELWGRRVNGISVLGGDNEIIKMCKEGKLYGVLAIASANLKHIINNKMKDYIIWENIIDPSACISPYAKLGRGNIIQPFVYVGSNAFIGNHCTINVSSVIGHDVVVDDYVSIMSCCDVAGNVHLKKGVYLGSGVSVIQGKKIQNRSIIGAGAVVVKDIDKTGTYIGVPARLNVKE